MSTPREHAERQGDPVPAPWGHPPTPVLPRWYRENLAEQTLPTRIKRLNPAVERIGGLDAFWDDVRQPLDKASISSLAHLAGARRPPPTYKVLPDDFDLHSLLVLPLRPRTHNCIRHALHRNRLKNATVGAFMSLESFGILSLLDLMCVTEFAISNSTLSQRTDIEKVDETSLFVNESELWIEVDESHSTIIAAARDFYGARTLGDILRTDLSRVISAADLDYSVNEVGLPDVGLPLASRAPSKLSSELENMTSIENLIVDERFCGSDRATLEHLGDKTGLSRERIRQLERKLKISFDKAAGSEIGILADVVSERVGRVTTVSELNDHIDKVLGPCEEDYRPAKLVRWMLLGRLEYSCQDGICLSREAVEVSRAIRDAATAVADDVGLINPTDLLPLLPSPEWTVHLPTLMDRGGLHCISDHYALRVTAKARAKAALISIGRSATREEIGSVAGLDPARVAGHLSSIPSIARADKVRWGLRDWIDDVYEGIPAEIIQRIEEDGGSTRLNRLLDELPRLFGVNEMSVRAYVATPAFRVEHGWVSIADEPDCVIGRFKDVASGRTNDDDPYWTFSMHERYRRGYSIVGIPPELAIELGCGFGGKTTVAVRSPQGSRPVSVNWRKTALTGPEVGRVADAMKAIAAREGDLICLIVHSQHEISFTRAACMTPASALSDGTNARIPLQGSTANSTPLSEGPYLGVRTGAPIAARLTVSARSRTESQDQASLPRSQPPTAKR